jgi:hypothetical protein
VEEFKPPAEEINDAPGAMHLLTFTWKDHEEGGEQTWAILKKDLEQARFSTDKHTLFIPDGAEWRALSFYAIHPSTFQT